MQLLQLKISALHQKLTMTLHDESSGIDLRLDRIFESIEMLTEQVGRLTEGLTEIRLTSQQQATTSQQQAMTSQQQAMTSQQQTDNITRLVTVVDRQTQMFEKLFNQQQP